MEERYGSQYWAHSFDPPYGDHEPWRGHFRRLAAWLVAQCRPATVLDVGCGWGLLVAALRDQGVDAYGIDVSAYAVAQVRADCRAYVAEASVTRDALPPAWPARFDVVTCIEVLEHIAPPHVGRALDRLAGWSDTVVFSACPPGAGDAEPTHQTLRPPSWWDAQWAARGFAVALDQVPWVSPWARIYLRKSTASAHNRP